MGNPEKLYDLLLDYASSDRRVEEVIVGLVWTYCRAEGSGLAMSPADPTRTLSWPGTLAGKRLAELAGWIRDWEPYRATVAMAAINAAINRRGAPEGIVLEPQRGEANLAVFRHFLPRLGGRKVVVVGRYPGLESLQGEIDLTVLERRPGALDLPDPAAEYLLPKADWVFLTASSITNKTFPRLAELAEDATTVLMGPTVPWLPELAEFGIDYLAGVDVVDPEALRRTVAEGGGVRIFDTAVRYRLVELTPARTMDWLRAEIAAEWSEKERLGRAMEAWYAAGNTARFPEHAALEAANTRLSRLDTGFKTLWDRQHGSGGESP